VSQADLATRLARLGGSLRDHDAGTTLRDEIDGTDAFMLIDRNDREEVRHTLRIALKIPRRCFDIFDRLFRDFWDGDQRAASPPPPPAPTPPAPPRTQPLRWDPDRRQLTSGPPSAPPAGEHPGYSPEALLRRKPFDQLAGSEGELAALERVIERLARRLPAQPSRRLVPTRGRGRPDLRASYRRALGTSGELLVLARRARARTDPRLVFLCDTSGSMDAHIRFLLTFALAVRRAIPRAEVYALNTELAHLSRALTPGKVALTLDRLAAVAPDWSGGTRLGACLATFVERDLHRVIDSRTVVIVLSDGLDRGDPARLAEALERIRGRARALIWLNPLLGDARYQPLAAGMAAALPFVDHFASAHDLASLERALDHLRGALS
jgi:uncharacterized protein with von Willebrand factor type A (vWA) domain